MQKLAIDYSDGIIQVGNDVNPDFVKYAEEKGMPMIASPAEEDMGQVLDDFYNKVYGG